MNHNPDCFFCKYSTKINEMTVCTLNCGFYKRNVYCTLYEKSWSTIISFYLFSIVFLGTVLFSLVIGLYLLLKCTGVC